MALMRTLTALILIQAVFAKSNWNYNKSSEMGPKNWQDNCKGNSQSPIDIKPGAPELLEPLRLVNYEVVPQSSELENNGHAVKLTNIYGSGRTPEMSGVGLPTNYKFAQVHFHWGSDSSAGSEHTLNGRAYPMEMHLVHYKADYHNISEAITRDLTKESLAVLGIFFRISPTPQPGIEKLLPHLREVREVEKEEGPVFPLQDLLPADLSEVFRYSGSLTTPGCNEIVQWTVIKEPLDITEQQMEKFRELRTEENHPLVNNYRPTQQLNSREVKTVKTSQTRTDPSSSSSSSSSFRLDFTATLLVISSLLVALRNTN